MDLIKKGYLKVPFFVTTKVDQSNFYSDINTLIDSEFTTKKLLEKKK